jgi:N-methylhydantoinase B
MVAYSMAERLADALAALSSAPDPPRILAGGTDIYAAEPPRRAWFQPEGAPLLDISRLKELAGVATTGGAVRFGALATWTEIAGAQLPAAFDGLRAAALQVGGIQIQNRGTIGGNICNASPAADGVPPLLALDAEVELTSLAGQRRLPLGDFIKGNRRTALRKDELLTAVIAPAPASSERSVFMKLGARSYLVISIASVAVNVALDARGRVELARIAVGACSAAPVRLRRIERDLVGHRPQDAVISLQPDDGLTPIDDVRASAVYRTAAAETLLRRAVRAFAPADNAAA